MKVGCMRKPHFFFLLVLLLAASPSFAQVGPVIKSDCVITWVANSEPDLTGYLLYSGPAPGIYGEPKTILAPATKTNCSTLGIVANGQYYIAIASYDTSRNQSLISFGVPFYLQLPIAQTVIVSIAKSGTGSGTVRSSPAGINCGDICSDEFPSSTQVTLTARAARRSVFAGWIGGGCSGTGPCTVTATNMITTVFNRH